MSGHLPCMFDVGADRAYLRTARSRGWHRFARPVLHIGSVTLLHGRGSLQAPSSKPQSTRSYPLVQYGPATRQAQLSPRQVAGGFLPSGLWTGLYPGLPRSHRKKRFAHGSHHADLVHGVTAAQSRLLRWGDPWGDECSNFAFRQDISLAQGAKLEYSPGGASVPQGDRYATTKCSSSAASSGGTRASRKVPSGPCSARVTSPAACALATRSLRL
jgi:hypothetical protein